MIHAADDLFQEAGRCTSFAAICVELALSCDVSQITQPVVESLVRSLDAISELLAPYVAVPAGVGSRLQVYYDGARVV